MNTKKEPAMTLKVSNYNGKTSVNSFSTKSIQNLSGSGWLF